MAIGQAMQAPEPRGAGRLREGLWLLAFLLVVAAGVVTVALPELDKDPDGSQPKLEPAPPAP
jgi:hypothetical protein